MSKRARREVGGPSRKARQSGSIDPRYEFGIPWRQAFWAGDPLLGASNGSSIVAWRPSGAVRGAYLDGNGLNLPGVAGNYASTPDSAALSITGDITIVAKATLPDWTPAAVQPLVSKWTGANDHSYILWITASTGKPAFLYSAAGTGVSTVTATAAPPFVDGQPGWVAASFDVDDGAGNNVCKFWYSTDGVTWTQLGSTVTTPGATSIYDGIAPLEFGSYQLGTASNVSANTAIQVARIYSGSGFSAAGPSGSLVFDADFRRTNTGAFTASTGQNVTIYSVPWGAHLDPDVGLVLPGVAGNYAYAQDSAALSITGDITVVAYLSLTDWSPATANTLLAKYTATGNQRSYALQVNASGQLAFTTSVDGTATITTNSTSALTFSDGTAGWVAASFDVDDGAGNRVAKFWTSTDGTTWTQLGTTVTAAGATSIYDSTALLEIGAHSSGTNTPMIGAVRVARVYSGSGFSAAGPSGSLVFDADFRRSDRISFTADTGQLVALTSPFNAVQGTAANQPTFRSSTAAFNGRPTVQFDGGDYLVGGAGAAQAQPVSVVVVGQATSLSVGGVAVFCDAITAARMALAYYETGSKIRIVGTSALDLNGQDLNPHLLTALFNGASSGATKDGTSAGTGTTGAAVSPTAMTIGASYLGGQNLTGHIAFVGWYVGDITAHANWSKFKTWVREHYGITVA